MVNWVNDAPPTEDSIALNHQRVQVLARALEQIATAHTRDQVMTTLCATIRKLTGAQGATLVLAEDDQCHYVWEDSPGKPLWLGRYFPAATCVSGWTIRHKRTAVIPDIRQDERVPQRPYAGTYVRSLIMVPLGEPQPFAAIGAYWARVRQPDREEVFVLEALARVAWGTIKRRHAEEGLRQSEGQLAAIFTHAHVGLCEISLEGHFLRVNDQLCNMLGRSRETLLTLSVPDVTCPEDVEHSLQALRQLIETGVPVALDKRYVQPDGSLIWASSRLSRLDDEQGRPARILAVTVDLSERKQSEDALRASEARYRTLADLNPDSVLVIRDDLIHYANSAALHLLGAQPATVLGHAYWEFIDPTADSIQNFMNHALSQEAPLPLNEQRWRRHDGAPLEVEVSAGRIEWEGAPALLVLLRDIGERKQVEKRVWHHANFDALTGLPNRRLFRDRLEQEVKKSLRGDYPLGLLFIDLDGFKQVNDLLGHDAGDALLKQAAQRLESAVRRSDTVARLGGDEFTVILSELDSIDPVEQVTQKILDVLVQPFRLNGETVYVSGSVGITLCPNDAVSADELIRKADQAMYAAKNAGKNRFSYFTQAMDEKAHRRLRLANELRRAVRNGELEVHYQPVVELPTQCVVKAEALVRWRHPRFGLVPPAHFIPLAEESGIIGDIGNWVFCTAAAQAKQWSHRLGYPFQIGVNRSPVQFLNQGNTVDWLDYLERLGLPGQHISVEITEGLLLDASPVVMDTLLDYRDAGIQVAIDDFGTGYSSMAYLKKFDIDYLKIDQSFVRDMTSDTTNRTIAETIIVMAHKLGLKVIAEGIETTAQRDLLQAAGCDYGQGFLFSKAVPADVIERMLPLHRDNAVNTHD